MRTTRVVLGALTALLAAMAMEASAQQTGGLPALAEDLAEEIAARMAADLALGGHVEAEAAARMAADQALGEALAAETAARIAGDGALAGKGCGPGLLLSGFDAAGAPICACPTFDVRDHVEIPADFWWVRSARITGAFMNYAKVAPGAPVELSFEYDHWTIPECPACIIEVLVGFSHLQPDPANCVYNFFAPRRAGHVTTLTAPSEPGFYTISVSRTLEYSCLPYWSWATYPVAAVCVQ